MLTIGADPELFMQENGVFKSVFGLLKGDKANPFKVERGAVQVDGMAAEFNIDPSSTSEEFVLNCTTVMNIMQDMLPGQLVAAPVAEFGEEYMSTRQEEETELGCEPDYNAHTGGMNPAPDVNATFRTGAGHVHIGFCEGADITCHTHKAKCELLVKMLDLYLGVPSVLFDGSTQRRELYGKAGAYRAKSYGVEYRVLSNKWLENEELMAWVFNASVAAVDALMQGVRPTEQDFGYAERAINESDVRLAKYLIKQYGLEVPNV